LSKFFKNTVFLFIIIGIVKTVDTLQKLYISYNLGVNEASDVYWALITIPDYILVVTGLDTLNGVVNSEYSSLHSHKQYKKIFTSLSFIAFWISVISIVIVGLSILLKFPLINILFPGFDDYKKLTAVNLFSIILYIIFFKSISGFLITTSNSLKSFYIPAIIPVFLSVSIFAFSFLKSDDLIRNLAYGNLAGNIIIFIFLGLSFYKYREYFSFPSFKMDDVSKKIIFGCAATFLPLILITEIYPVSIMLLKLQGLLILLFSLPFLI